METKSHIGLQSFRNHHICCGFDELPKQEKKMISSFFYWCDSLHQKYWVDIRIINRRTNKIKVRTRACRQNNKFESCQQFLSLSTYSLKSKYFTWYLLTQCNISTFHRVHYKFTVYNSKIDIIIFSVSDKSYFAQSNNFI